MSGIRLLVFPIKTVEDPFDNVPGDPFVRTRCKANWSARDRLSETLNCQIKNNRTDYDQLTLECFPKNNPQTHGVLATYNFRNDKLRRVFNYYQSEEQKEQQCEKFSKRTFSYGDLFQRDEEVFNQVDWNVTTYAVVLLLNGIYLGHIYTWVSPVDPSYCFAMGIRARVDQVFLPESFKNVSHYLFEGVRKFAQSKGCQTIIVTFPMLTIIELLKRLGFSHVEINTNAMGKSLATTFSLDEYCRNCYQLPSDHSIMNDEVTFDLVE